MGKMGWISTDRGDDPRRTNSICREPVILQSWGRTYFPIVLRKDGCSQTHKGGEYFGEGGPKKILSSNIFKELAEIILWEQFLYLLYLNMSDMII